jgi:hypothetical protein
MKLTCCLTILALQVFLLNSDAEISGFETMTLSSGVLKKEFQEIDRKKIELAKSSYLYRNSNQVSPNMSIEMIKDVFQETKFWRSGCHILQKKLRDYWNLTMQNTSNWYQ